MLVVRKAGAWDDPVNRDEADSLTPSEMSLVEMLLGSWGTVLGAAGSAAVVQAIIRRDADAVIRALGWDKMTGALDGLPQALASEVISAAGATSLGPQLNLSGSFDLMDPRAISWAQQRAGRLIVEITDQQRGLVRNIITEALADGITVDATAARIRQVVGLTDRYAGAVANARARTFDSLIKAGLDSTQAAARADALADRYRQRLLQSRATTIARTEILAASNQGRFLAWQEGVSQGLIHPDSVKEWRTAPGMSRYGPPCPHCAPYAGIRARWDQPFSNGAMMPPLHPNCRCTAVILPPEKGVTDQGQLGDGEGWEDDGQTFAGTRCDLCPGNCGRRYPVNVRVIKSLTVCSGLPGSAPENAVPVKSVEEVDPGDVIYFDGSTGGEAGLQVVGPGSKPGTLKVKSTGSKGSTYDLSLAAQVLKGKKFGLVPGPIKVAKAQAFDGTPGAPIPPNAPSGAIPVTKGSQIHPGDILYTSKQKNAQGYEVLGVGPNGGILYYSPGAKKKFEIDIDGQAGKTAFAITPGPNKAQHVLGTLGPDAKPPGPPTIAGGDPNPTMWQPKPYRYTAYAGGNGGTVEIVSISPSGTSAVVKQYVDGNWVEFTVDTKDLLGVPTGSKFMHHGQPKEVASVDGNIVKFTDGTQTTFGDGALAPVSSTAHKKLSEPEPAAAAPAPVEPPSTPNPNGTLKPAEGDFLPPFTDSYDLLGTQTAGPAGSNTAKPGGFWTGKDGKKYYVKAYADPEQAFQELLANRLYSAVGVKTPRTTLSTWTDPATGQEKVLIATEILDNKGTVGSLGLTVGRAKDTVDGFAADAWLANFDAVGTGLDNIVVLADGSIARIDAGGSLLYRAQGKLKTTDPTTLHEVDLGAFFTQNTYYKQVLSKAGVKSIDDLDLADQVALLRKTVDEAGGTKKIVEDLYEETYIEANLLGLPLPLKPDLGVLADLLEARLKSLEKKYPSASPVTGKPTIAVGSTLGDIDVTAVGPGTLFDANGKMQYLISDVSPDGYTIITVSTSGKAIGTDKMPLSWLKDLQENTGSKSWKVLATDAPVPRGWEPKIGYVVSHADYPDSSYKVVGYDPATGKVTIESKTGKQFDADAAKITQLKEGTPVYLGGTKHKVVVVEGDSVVLLDGSKVPLSNISPATHTGGTYPGETPAARRTTTPTQTTGGPWPDATQDPFAPALPDTLGVVPKGFTRPDSASADALANPQKGAYVAWDGGDVEGLEVRMTGVMIEGEQYTEARFKLTSQAKDRLADIADKGAWTRDDVVYVHAVDPVTREVKLVRGSSNSREDGSTFSYINSQGRTYVRTLDDGTKIVFTVSPASASRGGAAAFDGQVRIFRKGPMTEDDMAAIMRELHVGPERNRYPSREDTRALAENKILNLFARSETRQGKLTTDIDRQQALARIKQAWGVGPEDLEMVPGPNGSVDFLLPKKIAADIKKRTKTTAFYADLTGSGSTEEQIFKILTNPRQTMMSTTQRRLEGVVTGSMSQSSDIGTGGADYVFTRQAGRSSAKNGRIVWKSDNLFRRVDWYSYENDSYGTLLPGSVADRVDPLSAVAYHGGSRETMWRHGLSFEDATIYVDARTRDRLLQRLRDAGITEVSGVPIEKLIVATR